MMPEVAVAPDLGQHLLGPVLQDHRLGGDAAQHDPLVDSRGVAGTVSSRTAGGARSQRENQATSSA